MSVDLILHNGKLFSNGRVLQSDAIAVKHGRIIAVGESGKVCSLRSSKTRVVNLKSAFVCAGFIDAHWHLSSYVIQKQRINLHGITEMGKAISLLKSDATKKKQGEWNEKQGNSPGNSAGGSGAMAPQPNNQQGIPVSGASGGGLPPTDNVRPDLANGLGGGDVNPDITTARPPQGDRSLTAAASVSEGEPAS